MKLTCPGCGYKTVKEEEVDYTICPICDWEYVTQQHEDPHLPGTSERGTFPNEASLFQHQLIVKKVLIATGCIDAAQLMGYEKDPSFTFIEP